MRHPQQLNPPAADADRRAWARRLAMALITTSTFPSMAQSIKWYERPGQWFRNLLFAPRAQALAPLSLGRHPDGRAASLAERTDGLLLVCFWASWCGYCRKELPLVDQVVRTLRAPRLQVWAVNVFDEPNRAEAFLAGHDMQMVHTRDADAEVARSYALSPLPTSVLVDARTRRILHRWEGLAEADDLYAVLRQHLVTDAR